MNFKLKGLVKTAAFRTAMEEVFFEAMNAGYANNPQKGTIIELPGSKTITYVRRPWEVIDTYLVTPLSSKSGGMTAISYENVPVWMMQYFGEYDEDSIPCLKAALREAYSRREFIGGRGPRTFRHEKYEYWNLVELGRFGSFHGREGVNKDYYGKRGSGTIGYHSYQGGLML